MIRFFVITVVISIVISCNSVEDRCSETRELTINPEKGIGPYYLGMTEKQLIEILCPNYTKREDNAWFSEKKTIYYFLGNISFKFKKNRLAQITVWGTFKGSYEDIDVNYDKGILEGYGEIIEHDGEYRILDVPHISFGTENSDDGKFIKIYE